MSFAQFQTHLRQGEFSPAYFIFGPDAYLRDAARKALMEALSKAWEGEPPSSRIDLDQTRLDELLVSALTPSLFAPRQVLHIRGVMKLRDRQIKELADYLARPNPATVLVFLAGELSRDDRRKKIFKTLQAGSRVVDLAVLSEAQARSWIAKALGKRGHPIQEEAVECLVELQGTDLGRLHLEVEKLALLAGEGKTVTLEMVQELAGYCRDHTVFDFLDAVLAQDRRQALRLCCELSAHPAGMLSMVTLLGRRLRNLLQIQEISPATKLGDMARQIGANPYFLKRLLEPAKRFRRQTLVTAIDGLASIDDGIKRSSPDSRLCLERLVADLSAGAGSTGPPLGNRR
ncbi:MAG: DNA polymerase III subunit delta [Acidobacteriota bacterium]|nr:DNA polymerase III subunit delta [Acidobacteriota bacterium]